MRNRTIFRGVFVSMMLMLMACGASEPPFVKFKTDAEVPRISVADAKKEVDAGNAVIVDSRGEVAYNSERIAGSLNVTSPDKFSELPKGKKIIVYCS